MTYRREEKPEDTIKRLKARVEELERDIRIEHQQTETARRQARVWREALWFVAHLLGIESRDPGVITEKAARVIKRHVSDDGWTRIIGIRPR